jgi:energy-coupling factor transport system ATP-binding protein
MVSIEFDNVTFSYGPSLEAPLFSNLNLNIAAGEWVVVVGPSGAGKTTLLKLMKGLLIPQAGEVRVNGSILSPGELNHSAACVFTNPENQIVSPVVYEDVSFGLENMGLSPEIVRIRAEEALRWVGLWERVRDLSHHLSGGEQQRLILAGALALRKRCLLLDDPFSMVDGASRAEMLRVLNNIHREESFTLVQATHLLEEALVAQRLLAMEHGRLVFDNSPSRFLQEKGLIQRLGMEVPAIAKLGETLASKGLVEAGQVITMEQLMDLLTVREDKEDNEILFQPREDRERE